MRCQNTISTMHPTTISPSKNHDETRVFSKTPLKTQQNNRNPAAHHSKLFS
jgi:hypothetical protein